MIFGVGTDIVAVQRMSDALGRHGERFAERILAPEEMAQWQASKQQARFLAKRFAAKEAFAKALGTGVTPPATLHAIRVEHDTLGKPCLAFGTALAKSMQERQLLAHLSISDESEYAVAFVVIETAPT